MSDLGLRYGDGIATRSDEGCTQVDLVALAACYLAWFRLEAGVMGSSVPQQGRHLPPKEG